MNKLPVTSKQVAQLIAAELMLPFNDVVSKNRAPYLSRARQISMYLLRKILNRNHIVIGRVFNRDRSTVTHHINNMIQLIETDVELRQKVERIEMKIRDELNRELTRVSNLTLPA